MRDSKEQFEVLRALGINNPSSVFYNLTPSELVQRSLDENMGVITDEGALLIMTGKFTGRSPKDRFIVKDEMTANTVDWNQINLPFEGAKFDQLNEKILTYFENKPVYVQEAYACADPRYRLNIRLVAEYPWSAQFATNMFRRYTEEELESFSPDWTILCAPGFMADPNEDGTRQENFAIIDFTKQRILIGGTGYTGEIKKGIFSVLNYTLPKQENVLSMHCSANVGMQDDAAVFFGLSGTGKTTLSADPNRRLIGDDEHGWSDHGIFNFEGGCYAKTIDLSEEREPEIFHAIRPGAILENLILKPNTKTPDFEDTSITQNTRVSYPLDHIENIMPDSMGGNPTNIFFLTADAFGVLPPIAKLTPGQAMYHFISGYTAKVAGTEEGITQPVTTFSACFGAPFMPLHPTEYAEMLGARMNKFGTKIWLINTGWSGGTAGEADRIALKYTRAMITAALIGDLDQVEYQQDAIFGLYIPQACPGVPDMLLNPRNMWEDKSRYDEIASELARAFVRNFEQFADKANKEIMDAAPNC